MSRKEVWDLEIVLNTMEALSERGLHPARLHDAFTVTSIWGSETSGLGSDQRPVRGVGTLSPPKPARVLALPPLQETILLAYFLLTYCLCIGFLSFPFYTDKAQTSANVKGNYLAFVEQRYELVPPPPTPEARRCA